MADGGSHNVPKAFVRTADHHLLPPRVGHNWNDQAFRKCQDKPQQLEGELRGKRAFVSSVNAASTELPENLGETAHQLVLALSRRNPRGLAGSRRAKEAEKRLVTLEDKVLRFYAYFRERAPEGGANQFWHRRVVIHFFPVDDTILIQEPVIPNSGLDGGTYLKRQRVAADPRQRELFPEDDHLTLNFFNVGETVRINAVEFHLYDCDAFTREFLTTLGVVVGPSTECPDDEFMEAYKRHEQILLGAKFGVKSQDYQAEETERTARFMRDGGKILRFKAILDERGAVAGGIARRLELFLFVEDNSISITETPTDAEATPALFLSRCFLPKSGSLARVNQLSFSHRVNGQREPDVGPEGIYRDIDLDVGLTINVLGRPVLLYDCDDFTREFYQQRFGVTLQPSMAREVEAAFFTKEPSKPGGDASGNTGSVRARGSASRAPAVKDELRFRLALAEPKDHDERFRRFTLTYYTDTNEVTVYETNHRGGRSGGGSTCLLRRQPLRKPVTPRGPRNDPQEKLRDSMRATAAQQGVNPDAPDVYHEEDFRIGKEVLVCGRAMRLTAMDAHTEAYFTGVAKMAPSEATVDRLLGELREFLGSRYGTAVKAFLAFDHDRDGVIGLDEFVTSLKAFQITEDPALAEAIFARITAAPFAAFYLTAKDLMRWMGESMSGSIFGTTGAAPGAPGAVGMTEDSVTPAATSGPSAISGDRAAQQHAIAERTREARVLTELRERLEARQMTSVGMFRLASTMPRAYKQRRADVYTLFNPDRDAKITPVQLRRCCEEILGTTLAPEEMAHIVRFFFPDMPPAEQFRLRDDVADYAVDLPTFQKRYQAMCRLAMLPDSQASSASAAEMKTSVM